MLTYSQNDPQLMSKLLALLQDKDTEHETVRLKFYNLKSCILSQVCVLMNMVAFYTFLNQTIDQHTHSPPPISWKLLNTN